MDWANAGPCCGAVGAVAMPDFSQLLTAGIAAAAGTLSVASRLRRIISRCRLSACVVIGASAGCSTIIDSISRLLRCRRCTVSSGQLLLHAHCRQPLFGRRGITRHCLHCCFPTAPLLLQLRACCSCRWRRLLTAAGTCGLKLLLLQRRRRRISQQQLTATVRYSIGLLCAVSRLRGARCCITLLSSGRRCCIASSRHWLGMRSACRGAICWLHCCWLAGRLSTRAFCCRRWLLQ